MEKQEISLTSGDQSAPSKLTFSKTEDGMSLISSGKLPEGTKVPTTISLKTSPDADMMRASMTLDLSDCPSCDYKEYACTCDHHGHGHGHGDHDHGPGTGVPHDHDGDGKPDH